MDIFYLLLVTLSLSVHDDFWCRDEDCQGEDCGEENKDHQAESVHDLQC